MTETAFDPVQLRRDAKKRGRLETDLADTRARIAEQLEAGKQHGLSDTELGELANLTRVHVWTILRDRREANGTATQ